MALPIFGAVGGTALRSVGAKVSSGLFGTSTRSVITGLTAGSLIPDGLFGGGSSDEPGEDETMILAAIAAAGAILLFGVISQ